MRLASSKGRGYHRSVNEGSPGSRPEKPALPVLQRRSPRRLALFALLAIGALVLARVVYAYVAFPSDRTPQGAYLRVAIAVNRGKAEDFFAYTETRAQHAAYTIRDFRKKARARVLAAYPEPERTRLAEEYRAEAEA